MSESSSQGHVDPLARWSLEGTVTAAHKSVCAPSTSNAVHTNAPTAAVAATAAAPCPEREDADSVCRCCNSSALV
eukprot:2101-Heterococcus_DN1.PRE.1